MSANPKTSSSKIIKFEDGVPITVILDGKRGVAGEPIQNQWGTEEFRHFVNNDANIIYLPAAAQKQLEVAGAQFRDWVTITKVRGGKNQIWRVTVEEPMSEAAEIGIKNYQNQRAAVSPIRETLTGRAVVPPAESKPDPVPVAAASTQIPISAAAVLMDMSRPEAKQIASALFNAIDAFAVAQAYASSKGLAITFAAEDIRSFAISAYINSTKGGVR